MVTIEGVLIARQDVWTRLLVLYPSASRLLLISSTLQTLWGAPIIMRPLSIKPSLRTAMTLPRLLMEDLQGFVVSISVKHSVTFSDEI
jgi:hypothetical protein